MLEKSDVGLDARGGRRDGHALKIANFMDSSLRDLAAKGVLGNVAELYNPGDSFETVFHFTPHEEDLSLHDHFASHRIRLIHHPSAWLSPVRFFRSLRQTIRLIRAEGIGLVRGRLPYLGSLIGCIAARLCGVPFVVSLGGDNRIAQERNHSYHYKSKTISYGMEWLVLKVANKIIVPNQFTRAYVERIIGRRGAAKCAHIPWPSVPLRETADDDDETLNPLALPQGAAIVPIIGFLNPYKFTDILFEALCGQTFETGDRRPVHFYFCGDGPLRETGEARFRGQSNVTFLGWQDSSVVHALLRRSEFVLIPMSGLVLLEAASIGKPVVTSNVEWHSEMIEDSRTGLTVDPYEPESWRQAIGRMLANVTDASAMGDHLKKLYWKEYAPQRSKDAEIDLYLSLTSGKASS